MERKRGHTFCLPDYYSFDSYRGPYVGGYSIMARTQGPSPDNFTGDKYRLGWIGNEAVDCLLDAGSSKHVLTPLAVMGPGKQAVIVAASEISALIAEVRIAAGVDSEACAPGVLLTVVNTLKGGFVGLFDDLMDAPLVPEPGGKQVAGLAARQVV